MSRTQPRNKCHQFLTVHEERGTSYSEALKLVFVTKVRWHNCTSLSLSLSLSCKLSNFLFNKGPFFIVSIAFSVVVLVSKPVKNKPARTKRIPSSGNASTFCNSFTKFLKKTQKAFVITYFVFWSSFNNLFLM